jgi:hypothetical protein
MRLEKLLTVPHAPIHALDACTAVRPDLFGQDRNLDAIDRHVGPKDGIGAAYLFRPDAAARNSLAASKDSSRERSEIPASVAFAHPQGLSSLVRPGTLNHFEIAKTLTG